MGEVRSRTCSQWRMGPPHPAPPPLREAAPPGAVRHATAHRERANVRCLHGRRSRFGLGLHVALNPQTQVALSLGSACAVAVVVILVWPVPQHAGTAKGSHGLGAAGPHRDTKIVQESGAAGRERGPIHGPWSPSRQTALASVPGSGAPLPESRARPGYLAELGDNAELATVAPDRAPAIGLCAPVRSPGLRGGNPAVSATQDVDLRCADLRDAALTGADLTRGDLRGADLTGAHLQRADLRHADLRHVTARGADMAEARLTSADLSDADLRDVTFRCRDCPSKRVHANFWWANLQGADLRGADFGKSDLGLANLQQADLRGANLSQVLRLDMPPDRAFLQDALYDASTELPPDFDPASRGMLLESRSEGDEP